MPMTNGFQGWKNYTRRAMRRWWRASRRRGGVIIGKASLSEFAKGGGDNINSVLPGFARNPYNTAYATGGSSGGSAAALASRFRGRWDWHRHAVARCACRLLTMRSRACGPRLVGLTYRRCAARWHA